MTGSRKRINHPHGGLPKWLQEKLTRQQRQEQQDLLRRYDDRPMDDQEPPPRWM